MGEESGGRELARVGEREGGWEMERVKERRREREKEGKRERVSEKEKGKEGGRKNQPHHIPRMIIKLNNPNPRINIPKHTSHIPRTSQNLSIIQKPTTTQIPRMGTQLPSNFNSPLLNPKIINTTNVIQSSTGNKISTRRISASHDPGGTERDSVNFVGRVGVPDY